MISVDQEHFENLIYRHAFACITDLINHSKDIQEELEDLYLNVQDLEDLPPEDRDVKLSILEQRLLDRQYRRRNRYLYLYTPEEPES